ncbi:MAG TPA: AMP-binding protein [Nevskiaceae bacterium]|nr:AMP-binding protein [Nevskiaceae bacterium]
MADQKNPLEMLFHWEQVKPNQRYLIQPVEGQTRTYTFAQAADQVRRMAAALKAMNFEPGARIAISGRNTAHWLFADLAISMAGYVAVGLYPKQAESATKYILEHSETRLIFVGPMPDIGDFMRTLPKSIKTVSFPYPDVPQCDYAWDDLIAKHEPLREYKAPAHDALLTLIYTSGTTGNPKGVMITYGNMIFAAQGLMRYLPPQGQEVLFSYLPLAHAFERGAVELGSLYFGAEVHFLENIEKLAQELPKVAPTRFFGVPLVYGRIQAGVLKKLPQHKLDRLMSIPIVRGFIRKKILKGIGLHRTRYVFSGAAPLPIPLMDWFKKVLGFEILQGYGMTENSIYASANLPGQNRIGSVGKNFPDSGFKLSDEGEILYKSQAVMAGYYREPEKTKETFTADGYLRTGDKGRVDADGYLYITGRVKDIFKTLKGKYVAPAPIEGALSRNTDIDQLCFVGSGLKQPIMLVTLTPDARKKPREDVGKQLVADMELVNSTLEPHEEIAKIIVVGDTWTIDNGFMTPTMKVKRAEVEKRYADLLTKESENRNKIAWA